MSEHFRIMDRADGVEGHCCVGREVAGVHGTYWEFWTGLGWASAGKVYSRKEAGQVIWALESMAALTAERDDARAANDELARQIARLTEQIAGQERIKQTSARMCDGVWKDHERQIAAVAAERDAARVSLLALKDLNMPTDLVGAVEYMIDHSNKGWSNYCKLDDVSRKLAVKVEELTADLQAARAEAERLRLEVRGLQAQCELHRDTLDICAGRLHDSGMPLDAERVEKFLAAQKGTSDGR